jgi:putative addiction module component (TIGR02574 family)
MTNEHQTIFQTALALPQAERALLAEQLLESLAPESEELTDDEFYEELERRRAEVEQDPSSAIAWTDVVKD